MKADISISDALREQVLFFDGAMGTELYQHGVFVNRCFEELCLTEPDMITDIHRAYAEAGADVLTTNSFGANPVELARYGLLERLDEVNRAAAHLARNVADDQPQTVYVAGSVGPLKSAGAAGRTVAELLAEQVRALIAGGVDFILFETQSTRDVLENCARAMEQADSSFPFILSAALLPSGESVAGESMERMLATMPEGLPSPAAWGLNCGVGPNDMLPAVERAVKILDVPLVVQPNAGVPREVGNRSIYMCSPEYITSYARRFFDLGVRGIGGCCGTGPSHIRELVNAVRPLTRKRFVVTAVTPADDVEPVEPSAFSERSRLAWRLANQHWVTTVEIVPPRGYDLEKTIERSRICHRHGVDAINIPDGPRASSRISPLVAASAIQREAGIETILHFCCRDRNLIGMQADLFACAACGLRNILFVTGDPPKLGNYPFASGVFDVDSIGLVAVQDKLNRGIDIGGQAITPPTHAVKGVGADPNAIDPERELRRFREKEESGADFAITQPVFDPDSLLHFLDQVQDTGLPVIAGIWPLASLRQATFMQNEVPGVVVPDAVMQRMASVETRDEQREIGIRIAREAVARVRDRVAGIQVSAPFGNVHTALAVIEN